MLATKPIIIPIFVGKRLALFLNFLMKLPTIPPIVVGKIIKMPKSFVSKIKK